MPLDKKELKPLTDILGYAVLDSQRLEYSIAFIMLLVNDEYDLKDPAHNEAIDKYMEEITHISLGNLITRLKKIITLDTNFEEKLKEALLARNYLIHNFITKHGESLLNIKGREEALKTIKEKRKILYDCYFFLDPFIKELMELRGTDPNIFVEEIASKYEQSEQKV